MMADYASASATARRRRSLILDSTPAWISAFVKSHDGREAQRTFNGNDDRKNATKDQQDCRPQKRGWIKRRNTVYEFGYALTQNKRACHSQERPDCADEDSLFDEQP